MIRVSMRNPDERTARHRVELLGGDRVGEPPTSEVSVTTKPGIRHQQRIAVADHERRVAHGLKTEAQRTLPASQSPQTIPRVDTKAAQRARSRGQAVRAVTL
jgi:hypothetical protein